MQLPNCFSSLALLGFQVLHAPCPIQSCLAISNLAISNPTPLLSLLAYIVDSRFFGREKKLLKGAGAKMASVDFSPILEQLTTLGTLRDKGILQERAFANARRKLEAEITEMAKPTQQTPVAAPKRPPPPPLPSATSSAPSRKLSDLWTGLRTSKEGKVTKISSSEATKKVSLHLREAVRSRFCFFFASAIVSVCTEKGEASCAQ